MSKILFVEDRFRTVFWKVMAKKLQDEGHSIFWIVQNHSFKPTFGDVHVIPYPRKKDLSKNIDPIDLEIGKSDRNINHFKYPNFYHYPYYRSKINNILDIIKPDVAFGESTLFHELITIDLCRHKSIPYLHPTTCRFPPKRFSFYQYDTLEPFSGSGEKLDRNIAIALIDSIANRKVVPDYMKKKKVHLKQKIKRAIDLTRLSIEYSKGEHFNTPHPHIKQQIEKEKHILISNWEKISKNKIEDSKHLKVLYPLQFQPEANLDVWGRPFRDQFALIKALIENLPDDVYLYIKPNPKSKYEITQALIDYISENDKIIPISHSVDMKQVFPYMDLVVTVTGTIAMECIISGKPILTLKKTLNNTINSCIYLENIESLGSYIDLIKKNQFPDSTLEEKIEYINLINSTSFAGIASQSYLYEENIDNCAKAFKFIVNKVGKL